MNGKIAERLIGDLFTIPDAAVEHADVLMVNMNSFLSPASYITVLNDLMTNDAVIDFQLELTNLFSRQYLSKYTTKRTYFYYKNVLNQDSVLREIYPKWRTSPKKNELHPAFVRLWKHFIGIIEHIERLTLNKVIKTETGEACFIPSIEIMKRSELKNTKILIVSRDPMDLMNAMNDGVTVWDSKKLYSKILYSTKTTHNRNIAFTDISPFLLPMIMMITGIPKHNYKGVHGLGIQRAVKLLMSLGIYKMTEEEIIKLPEDLRESFTRLLEFKPIFFLEDYIKKYGDNI